MRRKLNWLGLPAILLLRQPIVTLMHCSCNISGMLISQILICLGLQPIACLTVSLPSVLGGILGDMISPQNSPGSFVDKEIHQHSESWTSLVLLAVPEPGVLFCCRLALLYQSNPLWSLSQTLHGVIALTSLCPDSVVTVPTGEGISTTNSQTRTFPDTSIALVHKENTHSKCKYKLVQNKILLLYPPKWYQTVDIWHSQHISWT